MVAHAGLLGYGADFATRVNPHLILRAGVNFFQLEGFEDVCELAGRHVLMMWKSIAQPMTVCAYYLQ
jgi:hypothetical protein